MGRENAAATVMLLSWNVAGRVRRLPEQADRVLTTGADVVCLQEVSRSTAPAWRERLVTGGWTEVVVADTGVAAEQGRRRPLAALTAARGAVEEVVEVPGVPWPERVLSVRVGGVEVVNVHSPISPSPGLAKVLTHEAVHRHLRDADGPRLVCGDLNTPRREHADGSVWTFARDQYGRLRADRGERWDRAEQTLLRGLAGAGFRDAFRERHGFAARELSWEWPRWGGGYRLDHLIVSEQLAVEDVVYLHAWRREGLSDHSPLLARVARR